ncbi:ETX/MTX2 family pore-forming toxin [Bacillus cereus]
MKYKNRIRAKHDYKQAVLAATTTLTLSVSALAGPISAFAADSLPNVQGQVYSDHTSDNVGLEDQRTVNRFLTDWFQPVSVNQRNVEVSNITVKDTIMAHSGTLENTLDTEKILDSVSETLKTSDTVSTEKALENTLTVNIGYKTGVKDVYEVSYGLQEAFKYGRKDTTTHVNERSVTIPSQKISVPAGKKYQIQYVVSRASISGQVNDAGELKTKDAYANGLVYVNNGDRNISEEIKNATPYQLFKDIQRLIMSSTGSKMMINGTNRDVYTVDNKYAFLNAVKIDDDNQKVYANSMTTPFSCDMGLDYSVKLVDVTDQNTHKDIKTSPKTKNISDLPNLVKELTI